MTDGDVTEHGNDGQRLFNSSRVDAIPAHSTRTPTHTAPHPTRYPATPPRRTSPPPPPPIRRGAYVPAHWWRTPTCHHLPVPIPHIPSGLLKAAPCPGLYLPCCHYTLPFGRMRCSVCLPRRGHRRASGASVVALASSTNRENQIYRSVRYAMYSSGASIMASA